MKYLTDNIRIIFKTNIRIINAMDKTVFYFREQQYEKALSAVANFIDRIRFVLEKIIENREYFNLVTTEALLEMLEGILEAKKNRDYVLLADLLELQLINFLIGVQELIISKEEIFFDEESYQKSIEALAERGIGCTKELSEPINTEELLEKGYRIEFTSSGPMTLAAENEGLKFYFHTNHKIGEEAFLLARQWFLPDKKSYLIYGLGLGYHIHELVRLAKEAGKEVSIEVYEADLNVIKLACAFAGIKEILKNVEVSVIYDPHLKTWRERTASLGPEEAVYVHYPSFLNIRNTEEKELLKPVIPRGFALDA